METIRKVLMQVLVALLAVAFITGITASNPVKEPDYPFFNYPEEWRAITDDTMRVYRDADTLFIYFIHSPNIIKIVEEED